MANYRCTGCGVNWVDAPQFITDDRCPNCGAAAVWVAVDDANSDGPLIDAMKEATLIHYERMPCDTDPLVARLRPLIHEHSEARIPFVRWERGEITRSEALVQMLELAFRSLQNTREHAVQIALHANALVPVAK
jgi:hypothetical protein